MTQKIGEILLDKILESSREMAETRALEPLLILVMDKVIELFGAERGCIVIRNTSDSFDVRFWRGYPDDYTTSEQIQDEISTSILAEVIERAEPVLVQDALNDPVWNRSNSVHLLRLRSVMCVPLKARGEAIGAIYVENRAVRGRFKDEDLPPLTLFANQAAVSIANAALNDDLEARVTERTLELQQVNTQLEHSWGEAVEVNRLRTIFLGNVAHDLRAPLTIVIESLQYMREGIFGDLTPDQEEWLDKSLDASRHILQLTDNVFDLTKIEMGYLALHKQPTDLHELLTKTYRIAESLRRSLEVELLLALPAELPTVVVDPVRIRQVLLNLLANAFKFTTSGSVTLSAEHPLPGDVVVITVSDTGEGIPADKIPLLFQRFQQVDENVYRRGKGTGLGLAISHELVVMHKGKIWVESKVGVGSSFRFMLPINDTNNNTNNDASNAASNETDPPVPQ